MKKYAKMQTIIFIIGAFCLFLGFLGGCISVCFVALSGDISCAGEVFSSDNNFVLSDSEVVLPYNSEAVLSESGIVLSGDFLGKNKALLLGERIYPCVDGGGSFEGTRLAAAEDAGEDILNKFEEILPKEHGDILKSDEAMDSLVGPEAVIRQIIDALSGASGGLFAFFGMLIGCVALSAVAEVGEGRLSAISSVGVTVVFGAAIMGAVMPLFEEIAEALSSASEFFAAFIPLATAVRVSAGEVNTASVSAAGMNITVSVLSGLGVPFFLSVLSFGLCTGLVSSFSDSSVANLASGVRKFFMWAIGLVCALLMGALSLQTFIASARDSAAMRAAKYAASSMIPVVGGTVSGAMATLATGLSYIKSTVGAGALAVLLSILLSPLIVLILYRCAVSVASGLSGFLGVKRAEGLLSSVRGVFDLFVAVYSISSVLFIFEIAMVLMIGG